MQNKLKKWAAALLGVLLIMQMVPVRAHAVTVTAVDDTVLPVTEGTMPVRLGGEMYAPYSVFADVTDSAAYADDTVTMVSGENMLVFSTTDGTVYDQDMTSYGTPAYERNDTVYVPVELVCGKMGLGYSTLPVSDDTVLRITSGAGATDDAAFLQTFSAEIQGVIRTYQGDPGGYEKQAQAKVIVPEAPVEDAKNAAPPPVEEAPVRRSSRVYLCYYGPTTEYTAEVLDALKDAGQKATFFLPTDTEHMDDDMLRRMVGEGHAVGLLLYETEHADGDAMVQKLTDANTYLAFVTGAQTRLVSNAMGCQKLSDAGRGALTQAGYRLWDTGYDSEDITKTQQESYTDTVQFLTSTDAPISVRLRHGEHTAKITEWVSAYLNRQGISSPAIAVTMTPMNHADDIR